MNSHTTSNRCGPSLSVDLATLRNDRSNLFRAKYGSDILFYALVAVSKRTPTMASLKDSSSNSIAFGTCSTVVPETVITSALSHKLPSGGWGVLGHQLAKWLRVCVQRTGFIGTYVGDITVIHDTPVKLKKLAGARFCAHTK